MKKIIRGCILFYRSINYFFPVACKFTPTCSQYALEAFEKYSFGKAVKLTAIRLIRCNPFSRGGIDFLR